MQVFEWTQLNGAPDQLPTRPKIGEPDRFDRAQR
jgi:hypothetical protein